jgi:PAS domain S-box-containing protein
MTPFSLPESADDLKRHDRLLIVEDERLIALDMKDHLEPMGYDIVMVVSNGKDAVEQAEKLRPDLILMDIMLDGPMDGIETAVVVIERFDIPVLFLTSYGTIDLLKRIKKIRSSGYILKPFNYRELETNIALAIRTDRMRKQLLKQDESLRRMNDEYRGEIERYRELINELQDSEARLTMYTRDSPDGIFITDLKGTITQISDSGVRLLLQKDDRSVISTSLFDYLPESGVEALNRCIQQVFDEMGSGAVMIQGTNPMGIALEVEATCSLIRDRNGIATGLFIIARDIASWRKSEAEQRLAAQKLTEELQDRLERRDAEFASQAVFLIQANEFHRSLIKDLTELRDKAGSERMRSGMQAVINRIIAHVDRKMWKEFRTRFEAVHPTFYEHLHLRYPDLTMNEIHLCAFSRLQLSNKEIADLTFKSANSIKVARSRLRKKMQLPSEKEFYALLMSI